MSTSLHKYLQRVLRELEELEEVLHWFEEEVEDLDVSETVEQLQVLVELLTALETGV